MAKQKKMPKLSLFRSLVSFDAETGIFTWMPRPADMFPAPHHAVTWNKRFAGKRAFCTLSHNGYMYGALFEENFSTHRLAWYFVKGKAPVEVDHINGDRTDNRICNLRNVSRGENCKNASKQKRNTSGVPGVSWDPVNAKWQVRIGHKHLGRYVDFAEAVSVRKRAELKNGFHINHGREAT